MNSKKRQKRQSRADRRGEAILEPSLCACGCNQSDLLDVRHGQIFIKGHGGKSLLERRKAALAIAIEAKLIAIGYGVLTAQRAALAALKENWRRARDEMRKFGYDYLNMTWRTA